MGAEKGPNVNYKGEEDMSDNIFAVQLNHAVKTALDKIAEEELLAAEKRMHERGRDICGKIVAEFIGRMKYETRTNNLQRTVEVLISLPVI
jgi:hypothetical protein